MPKLLFQDPATRSPTAVRGQQAHSSNVFRLMRAVYETPDRVTQSISEVISERARAAERARFPKYKPQRLVFPDSSHRSPSVVDLGTFFMEFWNMKQAGELTPDETPAVWAVLMCAIDAPTVVRLTIQHCVLASGLEDNAHLTELLRLREIYKNTMEMTQPFISKLRLKLVEALREVASRSRGMLTVRVFDPQDASLLLSACETALVVKKEESRRWLQEP